MAFRRIWTSRILERERALSPFHLNKHSKSFRVNHATLATSAGKIHSSSSPDDQSHVGLMEDIRRHFNNVGVATSIGILHALRQRYPDHIVVQTRKETGILKLAKAGAAKASLDTNTEYYASRYYKLSSGHTKGTGRLKDGVELAKYDYQWNGRQFQIYAVKYDEHEFGHIQNHYILCPKKEAEIVDGRSKIVDELITAAAEYGSNIDNEIWIYDEGYWRKSHRLWKNVQTCKWEQVILNSEMKDQLVADVEGFFDRKEDYASFAVPWKRGIILHGLPGNGKTISIKALMRSLASRSPQIPTLYVKSLDKSSSHRDIRIIFDKARETAPCLLVFEDIDSLVSDNVKSFFLNEVDGLEGNDGIMMIGSTNYLDRLDAGISKRPSRFDRKYHFALPATPERMRYCEYWRSKLSKNSSLKLPSDIASAIADITEGFSFAYLQEAFVTALLSIVRVQRAEPSMASASKAASYELEYNNIWQAIKKQVETLRKEMRDSRKSVEDSEKNSMLSDPRSSTATSTGFGLGK